MSKAKDYPKATLKSALQLAEAVAGFAGSCSPQLAAEKMGRRISGAFSALIASGAKYGLVENKAGKLAVTQLYRSYKLAYTPVDALKAVREAFLSPPLFRSIYERFKGEKLPIEHFEKMLIREFGVPDDFASRVSMYFLEGARLCELMTSENMLLITGDVGEGGEDSFDEDDNNLADKLIEPPKGFDGDSITLGARQRLAQRKAETLVADFSLSIQGPGMNFSIEITDLEDLELVQITLRKIERSLKANSGM